LIELKEPRHWINSRSLVDAGSITEAYKYYIEQAFSDGGMPKLLPETVVEHMISFEERIEIPEEVRLLLRHCGRPTPLLRASRLERAIDTNCKIFLKREDILPSGSFKLCATIPQAYYAREEGLHHVFTDTAAGQTGCATSLASSLLGLAATIVMTSSSYRAKPLRRRMMELFGANVLESPTRATETGRAARARGETNGSQAVALSECTEFVTRLADACTISGSFTDATLTYNSVIGQEAWTELGSQGLQADIVIGCVGGGSSFGGLIAPYVPLDDVELLATESTDIPTLTGGSYVFDYPDASGYLPKVAMYSLGHDFQVPYIHTSGLRYHGCSPVVSLLYKQGRVAATAIREEDAFNAARMLVRSEGIIPSPESAYCIAGVIEKAKNMRSANILSIITGSGLLDMNVLCKTRTPIAI
jgi:tryptophan synthase beta chain